MSTERVTPSQEPLQRSPHWTHARFERVADPQADRIRCAPLVELAEHGAD